MDNDRKVIQVVKLGKEKPYEFDVEHLAKACENYLLTQQFLPHVFTLSCHQDNNADAKKRKMRHKPTTPMITLLKGADGLPGVVAIIRNKFTRKYQGEERYINELLQTDFKIVEIYNYDAFCDLVKWVNNN